MNGYDDRPMTAAFRYTNNGELIEAAWFSNTRYAAEWVEYWRAAGYVAYMKEKNDVR